MAPNIYYIIKLSFHVGGYMRKYCYLHCWSLSIECYELCTCMFYLWIKKNWRKWKSATIINYGNLILTGDTSFCRFATSSPSWSVKVGEERNSIFFVIVMISRSRRLRLRYGHILLWVTSLHFLLRMCSDSQFLSGFVLRNTEIWTDVDLSVAIGCWFNIIIIDKSIFGSGINVRGRISRYRWNQRWK